MEGGRKEGSTSGGVGRGDIKGGLLNLGPVGFLSTHWPGNIDYCFYFSCWSFGWRAGGTLSTHGSGVLVLLLGFGKGGLLNLGPVGLYPPTFQAI